MSNEQIKRIATTSERSAKTLVKTISDLKKTIDELAALGTSTETLTTQIEDLEARKSELEAEVGIKSREAAAELKLRILENKEKVLAELLKEAGVTTINPKELAELQQAVTDAVAGNQDAIDTAVAAVVADLTYRHGVELDKQKSAFAVEKAQLVAQADSKDVQIKLLTAQVSDLQAQVIAERQARVDVAKAEANKQGVVVNTGASR